MPLSKDHERKLTGLLGLEPWSVKLARRIQGLTSGRTYLILLTRHEATIATWSVLSSNTETASDDPNN